MERVNCRHRIRFIVDLSVTVANVNEKRSVPSPKVVRAAFLVSLEFYRSRDFFYPMCTFVDSFIILYSYFNITIHNYAAYILPQGCRIAKSALRYVRAGSPIYFASLLRGSC